MPKPPEPGLPWVLCRIGHPVQTVGRTGGLFIGGEPLELSKSTIIEWIDPSTLRPHPVNVEIYGDDDPIQDLIDSIIQQGGVLESLKARPDGTVISGHRRMKAAQAVGIASVPVLRVTYASEDDEREAIVEYNRYRKKTGQQFLQEGLILEPIYLARSRTNQLANTPVKGQQGFQSVVQANLPEPQTRDAVASAIGLGSGKQWDKLKAIGEAANSGDAVAQEELPKIGNGTSLNSAVKKVNQERKRKEQVEQITNTSPPAGHHHVLVIDPPWPYENRSHDPTHRSASPYETMTLEELENLPIPHTEDSIMWLWTTNAFLHDAFHLLRCWGFTYKTTLTWAKTQMGTGDWLRGKTEHCLLAIHGEYQITPGSYTTLFETPKSRHSAKPDAFYSLVEALCPGSRIDMFARDQREGWSGWGAEG